MALHRLLLLVVIIGRRNLIPCLLAAEAAPATVLGRRRRLLFLLLEDLAARGRVSLRLLRLGKCEVPQKCGGGTGNKKEFVCGHW